ncbi:MAG: septum formation protein Maf [Gemmataceae bacterium]|nr:septum formation protein Maf [Gemmataceae bacterium]
MAAEQPVRLILASGSPARRELLARAGYRFEVLPAGVDEPTGASVADIRGFVHGVAWLKAAAVAPRLAAGIVLAADSVGWVNGQVIGKPADAADARRILRLLGGTTHELWTGVVLWRRPDNLQLAWQEFSRVAFKGLTDAELDAYLATRTWAGCSGAYAVEGPDDPYIRVLEGTISNVVGLPLETTTKTLEWFGGIPRPPPPA